MKRTMLSLLAILLTACSIGAAQDVVSASSGVLHYFEGSVILDDKPIAHKAAVFPSLNDGAVIRTEKGKAELLLTPEVYLRIDDNTSVRMISNSLAKTSLELIVGSVILDSLNAPASDAVVLNFRGSEVHFTKPGIYRLDSDIGEFQIYSGEAKVIPQNASKGKDSATVVDTTHIYYFSLALTTTKLGDGATDEFYDWASNRSEAIANQTQLAAAPEDDDLSGGLGSLGGGSALNGLSGTGLGSGGIGPIYVVPPIYTSPGYAGAYGTPLLGYSPYGLNPLYSYQRGLVSPFASSVIVVAPYRRHWPVTATGILVGGGSPYRGTIHSPDRGPIYHPGPGLNRGLVTGSSMTSFPLPIHPPMTTIHPGISIPHVAAPHVSAPHVSAPHIGAVGHR